MTKAIALFWFALSSFLSPTPAQAHTVAQATQPNPLSACSTSATFNDIPCSEVDRALTEAAREFRLDEAKFRRVARCESGFNPFNSTRSYYGVFQHLKSEWAGRVRAFNQGYNPDVLGNPHSPFDNARIAAWMINNTGWGAWPVCQYR